MCRILAAFVLVPMLWTVPALAQKAATGATVPQASSAATASGAGMKPTNQAEMLKAQKASAARDKAWDARTKNSMTSICKGC